jgi:hypothetical protein
MALRDKISLVFLGTPHKNLIFERQITQKGRVTYDSIGFCHGNSVTSL